MSAHGNDSALCTARRNHPPAPLRSRCPWFIVCTRAHTHRDTGTHTHTQRVGIILEHYCDLDVLGLVCMCVCTYINNVCVCGLV
jgi:hypothetical protein